LLSINDTRETQRIFGAFALEEVSPTYTCTDGAAKRAREHDAANAQGAGVRPDQLARLFHVDRFLNSFWNVIDLETFLLGRFAMFINGTSRDFQGSDVVKSVLTGELISKESEEFRHEREVAFLSSLSDRGLESVLTGSGQNDGHRSITAIRGPAEVRFLRSQIIVFRLRSDPIFGRPS
jgi:hypothetical protein